MSSSVMSPPASPAGSRTSVNRVAGRFDILDALRGLAALVVVLWHWQHFFFVGSVLGPVPAPGYPLARLFAPFYRHGEAAVDLFFSISGFIFYWLYAETIAARSVSAGRFFMLRFSRLYPLHLLTLFVVAGLQLLYQANGHGAFVYPANTASNFVVNLLFIPAWVSRGFSFNAPIWSVSVEVFLYALFFGMCRWLPVSLATTLAAGVFGMLGVPRFPPLLARGMVSFFLGGAAALVYGRISSRPSTRQLTIAVAVGTVLVGAMFMLAIALGVESWVARESLRKFAILTLFPLTVLSLALLEHSFGLRIRRLTVLGDISYATYLWHFPLQLFTVLCFDRLGLSRQIFTSPLTLLAFFVALVSVGYASVHWFERPAQAFLRARFAVTRSSRS